MKFVTFQHGGPARLGALMDNDTILDLQAAFSTSDHANAVAASAFDSLTSLIEAGDAAIEVISELMRQAKAGKTAGATHKMSGVQLLAPIPRPSKNVFCIGRNYVDHVNEGYRARGAEIKLPEYPQFFTKPPTAIVAPGGTIMGHAGLTEKLDYEVELGLVIGKRGRDIPEDRALDHIFGYTIINDVTARDLQRRHDQWFKGKGLDGSCPMGPSVVLRADIADAQSLDIELHVNNELRQRSNTRHMIFSIKRIISELSLGLTLEPGDIIATGTPSGVGYAMDPPRALKAGDVVTCTIEGIGTLENQVA